MPRSVRVLIGLLALGLVAALSWAWFATVRWSRAERRARDTYAWTRVVMDSLGAKVDLPATPVGPAGRDSIYWQWVATSAQLQSRRWQAAVRYWVERRATLLEDYELRELGLAKPERQLRDSLVAHRELIPYEGVLGGTMGFYSEPIVLLQRPFVFAEFEDGHINGHMLLEYQVVNGRIHWKRLWSRLD